MPAAPTSAEIEAALGYEACVFRHFFEEASVGMALAGPDRAALAGGTATIESCDGQGTTVVARLPLDGSRP